MPREAYIPCLLRLFRQYGYDGATLSKISEATELGKASLYHHFPGGKNEMVEAVLEYLRRWMDENILQMLNGSGDALLKLQRMCLSLLELYEGGNQPCMFAILLMGSARDVFHQKVKVLFCDWINAIALVLMESGMDEKLAQQRAEETATFIQGSLILSQALGNPSVFQRAIERLPKQILLSRRKYE